MKEKALNAIVLITGARHDDTNGVTIIKGAALGFGVAWVIGTIMHIVETSN